ncbi:MAG: BMP family ABC transporter substrate-binding protein [Collinsella sp.]
MGLALAGVLALSVAGCGGGDEAKPAGSAPADASADYKVQMVTDMGGVNDQSFNQLAWEACSSSTRTTGIEVGYTESKQESDYATNLDKAVDDGAQTVWGIGFAMAEAIQNTAKTNPDVHFAIIDNAYPEADLLDNLTGVTFKTQEPFLRGRLYRRHDHPDRKVGFIGGMKSDVLETFDWGYQAGVALRQRHRGHQRRGRLPVHRDLHRRRQGQGRWSEDVLRRL